MVMSFQTYSGFTVSHVVASFLSPNVSGSFGYCFPYPLAGQSAQEKLEAKRKDLVFRAEEELCDGD